MLSEHQSAFKWLTTAHTKVHCGPNGSIKSVLSR